LKVHVTAELAGRMQAPVESAAYLAVSELLANVAKHAGAHRVWIGVRLVRIIRPALLPEGAPRFGAKLPCARSPAG
jgi:hypothetical protein